MVQPPIRNRLGQIVITKKEWQKLLDNAQGRNKDGHDPKPVVKMFGGSAGTWLFSEARVYGDDIEMFGLCDPGLGFPELGYASLNELLSIRFKPFGLPIERDKFWKAQGTLREYADAAHTARRIVSIPDAA